MRRISLHEPNAKVRNPARHLRALRRWTEGFAGTFPVEHAARRYVNWKIPVLDRLVRPPTTTPAIQRDCAQCLIDAAAHIARARPTELAQARSVAIIDLPDLFGSEVCVFFDEAYFESFTARDSERQQWTPLPKTRSLVDEMALRLPDGYSVLGFAEVIRDEETGEARESEVWLVGDCAPADQRPKSTPTPAAEK
ncbi:MAG: DUF3916 domain-containing protein [Rhodospirillales bacterium]|nr:DUF3916 domain-containing protein [Rhodospirillales bacterium]MDH3912973.1 DUF3916 domain-containing protein [Rhodospirillales bacterium]MDH3917608.1 DUF3916 domain-containing protein [Rhodospirillales bacterium]